MVLMNEKGECASPRMVRCMKCSFVRKGVDGWVCTAGAEYGKKLPDVETIADEDCPCEQSW
jgi:hypothetical protein